MHPCKTTRRTLTTGEQADVEGVTARMLARLGIDPSAPFTPEPLDLSWAERRVRRVFPDAEDDPAPRARRHRLPTLIKRIEQATGKTVTSLTMPDGTTFHFGELRPAAADDVLGKWLARRHAH